MPRFAFFAAALVSLVLTQSASAHYLWVVVDAKTNFANLYFEHSAAAGDGHYLEPFIKRGKMWVRTAGSEKPTSVKMTEVNQPKQKKRWLRAKVTAETPRSVDAFCTFGTYTYGKTVTLLHYYARHLTLKSRNDLKAVASAPHIGFRIEPRFEDGKLIGRVIFQNKPAAGIDVRIHRPGRKLLKLKTNDQGEFTFTPEKPGVYRFHAYQPQKGKSGEYEGKKYADVRHHSTLIVRLPSPR